MDANECDTNADTCCLGKNFVILEFTQRAADVYTYIKDIAPIVGVPIVSGETAWDDPVTGQTYILVNKCPNMWILSLEEAIQTQDPQSAK